MPPRFVPGPPSRVLPPGTVRLGRLLDEPRNGRLRDLEGRELQRPTVTERDLSGAILARPDGVFSRDELLGLVPGRGEEPFDRSIDKRITRLRRKIEADPSHPALIRTVRGGGCLYRPEEPEG